jgi:hypothetical protein
VPDLASAALGEEMGDELGEEAAIRNSGLSTMPRTLVSQYWRACRGMYLHHRFSSWRLR